MRQPPTFAGSPSMSADFTQLQFNLESPVPSSIPCAPLASAGTMSQPSFVPGMTPTCFDQEFMETFSESDMDFSGPSTPQAVPNTLGELEFMLSGESGMDERWMAFMRESGVLNPPT